jgi:uncharacterized FAD-dependent dehydrogenase
MLRLTELKLPLDHPEAALAEAVTRRLRLAPGELRGLHVFRRAYDARRRAAIEWVYTLDLDLADEAAVLRRNAGDRNLGATPDTRYRHAGRAPEAGFRRPVVVGAGPCGIFATLILAEMGFRPILLERGKVVRERTKDTWDLWRRSNLHAESNVQFGEGGAGTFSDGKLWSGIKDPQHLGRKVLEEFVAAGAPEEILYVGKPHIGTFRLVTMVESLRAKIEALGGEYRFGTKVADLLVEERGGQRRLRGLVTEAGETVETDHLVLALGHSARDTFEMLHARGVYLEAKPFSIGVRIEHPQGIIDRARFALRGAQGAGRRGRTAGASTARTGAPSTPSACAPAARWWRRHPRPGRLVTNGMSQYSRNERNARCRHRVRHHAGARLPGGPLAGIALHATGRSGPSCRRRHLCGARAARGDFLAGGPPPASARSCPPTAPASRDGPLALPARLRGAAIREALPAFGRQIRGFDMADAVMTGVETRTSSPVRIRRGDDFQSLNTRGLFPAGEGAGYAGGIFSAA